MIVAQVERVRDVLRRCPLFVDASPESIDEMEAVEKEKVLAHGEWCLDFMDTLLKPVALTLHTVLPGPSSGHASVTQRLCRSAAKVVVLSETARRIFNR